MTLIIYDSGVIYADKICSVNAFVAGKVTKIVKDNTNDILYGAVGAARFCEDFLSNPSITNNQAFIKDKEYSSYGIGYYMQDKKHMVTIVKNNGIETREIINGIYCAGLAEDLALGMRIAGMKIPQIFETINKYYYPIIGTELDRLKLNSCVYDYE